MAAGLSQAPQKEHQPGRKFGPGDPVIFKLCRFFVKAIGGSQTTAITRTCDRIDVYMCGIAGLVHIRGARLSAARDAARSMADSLAHRGPDDAGVWESADGSVALSHRRLSIIDLSPLGRNPMTWGDGRLWITFNGEIYNFVELRQRARGERSPVSLAHRHRSHPRRLRRMGRRLRAAARRHVRLRHLGRTAGAACGWRAIGWARSRSTTAKPAACCPLPRS